MTTMTSLILAPTPDPLRFKTPEGALLSPPSGWACLPPGDAGLTRRVKAAGPSWQVIEKKGRKAFSRGLWAPLANIEAARAAVDGERATPEYARKKASATARREREQGEYVVEFANAVIAFLRFSPQHTRLAQILAVRITEHATPVGSGTVARTERIPLEERAEAAVIAWMRHQITAYDQMKIANIKGARREVRRELAEISRKILDQHRTDGLHPAACVLCRP